MSGKWGIRIFGIIFALAGTAFLLVGVMVQKQQKSFMKNAESCNATIIRFEYYYDSDDEEQTTTIVEYMVDDVIYRNNVHSYTSTWNVGDSIQVYYNPSNPNEVQTKLGGIGLIFIGLPMIFIIVGVCTFISSFKKFNNTSFDINR